MAFRKLVDFIQEDVIVAMIKDKLEKKAVARNVVDVKTQAQLGFGSSYKIPGVGSLTVNNYNGVSIVPEDATSTGSIITLDSYPYVSFYLEDSDVTEANALSVAAAWANEAATRIALSQDAGVFAKLATGATAGTGLGVTGTPIVIVDAQDALDYVEKFADNLRSANVDEGSIVVPSFIGVKLVSAIGTLGRNDALASVLGTGFVGKLFGFDIFESNNLPKTGAEITMVGGKKNTFQLIDGLTIVKSGDSENRPATWNQYGQVYGSGYSNTSGFIKGTVSR